MRGFYIAIIAITTAAISASYSFANYDKNIDLQELARLTQIMSTEPDNIETYFNYAKISTKIGRYDEAINAYEYILQINPNLQNIKIALALVYVKMTDIEEGVRQLNEVLANDPPAQTKEKILTILTKIEALTNINKSKSDDDATITSDKAKEILNEELIKLGKQISSTPNDLDAYFKYAKLAEKLGNSEEAERAYKHMLSIDPSLSRVSLDLALLKLASGKLEEAKILFEKVLSNNPPIKVKENIESVLAKINNSLKKDVFSFSASLGVNRDSNPASVASTGRTTFIDQSIALSPESQAKADAQIFASASVSHIHKFKVKSENWGAFLTTSGSVYKSNQSTDHNLDISLASVKIGPTFTLPKLKSQVSLNGIGSIVVLNSFKYLKTRAMDLSFRYTPTNKIILDSTTMYEYRKYANSPSSTSNTDRTGNAYQEKLGITYLATQKDIFNASITWRNEEARAKKYGLDQLSLSGSYTRVLPYDITFNVLGGFKKTHYDDYDILVSPTKLRSDREKSYSLTVAKKLPKNVTVTSGYQYKNSNSNIENYTYVNHRFSIAFAWSY